MTFDEALNEIHKFQTTNETELFMVTLVEILRNTYAKPVVMTKYQLDVLSKYHALYNSLLDTKLVPNSWGEQDFMSIGEILMNELDTVDGKISEQELTRAWWNPKLIEVKEDETGGK